jgi:hypothetical protein
VAAPHDGELHPPRASRLASSPRLDRSELAQKLVHESDGPAAARGRRL